MPMATGGNAAVAPLACWLPPSAAPPARIDPAASCGEDAGSEGDADRDAEGELVALTVGEGDDAVLKVAAKEEDVVGRLLALAAVDALGEPDSVETGLTDAVGIALLEAGSVPLTVALDEAEAGTLAVAEVEREREAVTVGDSETVAVKEGVVDGEPVLELLEVGQVLLDANETGVATLRKAVGLDPDVVNVAPKTAMLGDVKEPASAKVLAVAMPRTTCPVSAVGPPELDAHMTEPSAADSLATKMSAAPALTSWKQPTRMLAEYDPVRRILPSLSTERDEGASAALPPNVVTQRTLPAASSKARAKTSVPPTPSVQ